MKDAKRKGTLSPEEIERLKRLVANLSIPYAIRAEYAKALAPYMRRPWQI